MKSGKKFILVILVVVIVFIWGIYWFMTKETINEPEYIPEEPDINVIDGDVGNQNIIGKKVYYNNNDFGIKFLLSEIFNGGFVHQEDKNNYHILTFMIKDNSAKKEETGINGYREGFSIWIVPIEDYEKFKLANKYEENSTMGINSSYYFIESRPNISDKNEYYSELYIIYNVN